MNTTADLERAVLGAALLSPSVVMPLLELDEHLRPEDFHRPSFAAAFEAMRALYVLDGTFDHLSLADHLQRSGAKIDGALTVEEIQAPVTAAGNVRQYARGIREAASLRGLNVVASEIAAGVNEGRTSAELREIAEHQLMALGSDGRQKDFRSIGDILQDETEKLHELSLGDGAITGVPSGFKDLDEATGGFQPGKVYVIGARPAMGKSAFVTNIADYAAERQHGVAMFSLEMSEGEIAQRILAARTSIAGQRLRRGQVRTDRWPGIMAAAAKTSLSTLYIDDTSDISVTEMRAKARRLLARRPIGMVIVDYLQLARASGSADNRAQAVGEMSRGLKILARELNVPVLVLSQLSRQLESRPDKRPLLSDLRESGTIEQDADVVMFLFRPEYYDPETEDKGVVEVIIAKHREGALLTVKLNFIGPYARFEDQSEEVAIAAERVHA